MSTPSGLLRSIVLAATTALLMQAAGTAHAFLPRTVASAAVERGTAVVRVYPRPASPAAPMHGEADVANGSASSFQRVDAASASPYAAVGYLDIVLLNGLSRRCTGTIVAPKVVFTSASCLKPGRDTDGALAAQIRFTPGQTQSGSGAPVASPSGEHSFWYYEMPTLFYDQADAGPDYAAIFFHEDVGSSPVEVALGQVPTGVQVIGYASTAAGEAGSRAQWQASATVDGLLARRLSVRLPFDQGLSGAPLLAPGSDGVVRLSGVAVGGSDSSISATRLLDSDAGLIRRWLGLPPLTTTVQSGWWWNPAESGRGIFLEIANGRLFLVLLGYGTDGKPTWYVTSGPMASELSFQGTLTAFRGGVPLGAAYRAAAPSEAVGGVSVEFLSESTARLTTPWGVSSIERFPIVANGPLLGPSEPPYPQSGFWWNGDEPGTAVLVEIQGGTMMAATVDYTADGAPKWGVAANGMVLPLLFVAPLGEVSSGPAYGDAWRPVGPMTQGVQMVLEVKAPDRMVLALSTGERIPLSRFSF